MSWSRRNPFDGVSATKCLRLLREERARGTLDPEAERRTLATLAAYADRCERLGWHAKATAWRMRVLEYRGEGKGRYATEWPIIKASIDREAIATGWQWVEKGEAR